MSTRCPHCGKDALSIKRKENGFLGSSLWKVTVRCDNCGAIMVGRSTEDVFSKWNIRIK